MSGFQEEQHPRDDHGRFSGGGLGAWAKRKAAKLEGYSSGKKGDLAAWTRGKLEHDPRTESSPLGKYIASKHSIDLDLMKARKDDRNPSTGELSTNNSFRASDFVTSEIKRLSKQKEDLVKEARKAEVSRVGFANKLSAAKDRAEGRDVEHYEARARVGDKLANNEPLTDEEVKKWRGLNVGFRITSPNAKNPDMASYHDYDPVQDAKESRERAAQERAKTEEARKLVPSLEKKVAAATSRRDAAHEKLGVVLQQYRSATEAEDQMRTLRNELDHEWRHDPEKEAGYSLKDNRNDYKLNVSHDRKGNWEINVQGAMRDQRYPGEKSMTYRVEAGAPPKIRSIDKHKAITFDHGKGSGGLNPMFRPDTAPKHTMMLSFPTRVDSDEPHPLEGEHGMRQNKGTGPSVTRPSMAEFFNETSLD